MLYSFQHTQAPEDVWRISGALAIPHALGVHVPWLITIIAYLCAGIVKVSFVLAFLGRQRGKGFFVLRAATRQSALTMRVVVG